MKLAGQREGGGYSACAMNWATKQASGLQIELSTVNQAVNWDLPCESSYELSFRTTCEPNLLHSSAIDYPYSLLFDVILRSGMHSEKLQYYIFNGCIHS